MDGDGSNASGDASESPEPELLVDQYAELPRILEVHLDRYEAGIQHHELRALWESLYDDGTCGITEMLFCTSLIALMGAADHAPSSPRKLQIVNTKRQSVICELLFPSSILCVKMNRKTLVVVLESEIYIYDISNMRLLHVIETIPNPEAICALSPSIESSYLAYPSPIPSAAAAASSSSTSTPSSSTNHSGDVLLFSTRSLTVANVIQAHKAPISSLSLNSTGTLLATSSEKGTVIRVWSVPGAENLYQFRRGTREATIYSINFNLVSTLLAVSSAHGTVHIFKLGSSSSSSQLQSSASSISSHHQQQQHNTWESVDDQEVAAQALEGAGYKPTMATTKKHASGTRSLTRRSLQVTKGLTSSMGALGSYLPSSLTEMWEPARDFTSFSLPSSGARTIVALSPTMPHVMVLSSEGYLYVYSIDLDKGGECSLLKQYSLIDSVDVDLADAPAPGSK